ncbi:MAG TPA: tRNA (guanosine(46)-N7)-methyltransferase TrmB [Vicinamibacteria bacterium]|nr:tRNA (guanosine(46)-N7)-methyltransferase TrmB [Vicinamibacteria bacterium]
MGRGRSRRKRELQPGPFGLTLEDTPKPFTARAVFGDEAPFELEVGSGKGGFLLAESERRPDVRFLGVERAHKYWIYAADRLRRHARSNARVILAEAEVFVREFLEDDSLAAVHIYFPDPWPKKRHHRRRLLKPDLVTSLAAKMRVGARLQVATDHSAYFAVIRNAIELSGLAVVPFTAPSAAADGETAGTSFERKYRREGRTVFSIAAERKGRYRYS